MKNLEFVTWGKTTYHFWKVTDELTLAYQEGCKEFDVTNEEGKARDENPVAVRLTKAEDGVHITTMQFAYPIQTIQTIYLIIGLSNGYVWTIDSRTNSLISQVKISNTAITGIHPKQS